MIYTDRLKQYQADAEKTILLQIDCAKKGHQHVVGTHVISCLEFLEMTSELLNFRNKYGEYEGMTK